MSRPKRKRPALGRDVVRNLLGPLDGAGGEWPARARQAALALSAGREEGDASYGVRLLADVRPVFDERGVDRISSADLCAGLNAIEDAPWGGWREGRGIDPRTLARRLRDYDVLPGTVRLADGAQAKGYRRERFLDAWDRYCPKTPPVADTPESQPSRRPIPHGDWDAGGTDGTDDSAPEAIRTAEIPHGDWDGTAGRLEDAERGNGANPAAPDPRQEEEAPDTRPSSRRLGRWRVRVLGTCVCPS